MAKAVKIKQIKAANQSIADVGTQLQIEIAGVPSRFKTTLVGMDPDKCLLVKAPKITGEDKRDKNLAPGDNIIVRYLYNGAVLGFQSKLIDSISSPMRLLFIEYPEAVENFDLRSKIRVQCFLPAKSELLGTMTNGVILDISEGGCRYQLKAFNGQKLPAVNIDDSIKLFCRFPGIIGEYEIVCKIKNITQDSQKKVLGIQYIEFVDLETKSIVREYIASAKSHI
jgi:Flagellar protein YcgR/PilZ domain